ncbi:PREDICTED: apolipoprotein L3-like, partial [Ceratotherium simum simum]|uniref:Apolipoprotein L3-like n=1 Tax=Ceratotherium simum simum TaxID=73337 RepID=A0ABM1C924_CERSS
LADKVDKVHRDCTISNVVAASTGTVSGILTILGLALAPVTAGVSLALSATGIGLGAAAAVTSVSTSIVERSSNLSAKAEASRLALIDIDKGEVVEETLCHSAPHIFALSKNFIQVVANVKKNVHAIKLATAKPHLAAHAKRLMTVGRISVHRGEQVQKAFGGTALAMTKGARVMGAATAGVFLLMDVISLVEESLHLHEGAKAESAEGLRQQAQELERVLEELTQIHEMLQ